MTHGSRRTDSAAPPAGVTAIVGALQERAPARAIGLADAARASAFLAGRDHVLPEEIRHLFVPVCAHRLILRPEHETLDRKELLQSLLDTTPVPLA